jgi:enoyl-CoA hydratase
MSQTQTPPFETIIYRPAEKIARITLNSPAKRNAISLAMRDELTTALKLAERNDEISVVLIDAVGPVFCSGADITPPPVAAPGSKAGYGGLPPGGVVSEKLYDGWTDQTARTILRDWFVIWDLLKPVVCKVQGPCLALGTELMSMCDIVFAADDARIGYPPMRGQSVPDTQYFPWKMSMAHAKYLQITGNSVTGKEAAQMGWIAKSFPRDELDDRVETEVRAMASISPDMLSANKYCTNMHYEIMGFRTALYAGVPWHTLSASYRPNAGEFRRVAQEKGLKEAFQWRDGAFEDLGG